MSIFTVSEMQQFRDDAESLMLDTFTAYAPAANTRDADGYETEGYAPRGSVVGKIQGQGSRDTASVTVTIEGVERQVVHGGLHIPIGAPVPTGGRYGTGWEYECTAVGSASDPSLLGSRWLVLNPPAASYKTARRLDVVRLR